MKKTSLLLVALMTGALLVACGKKEEPAKAAAPAPAAVPAETEKGGDAK